jgi:hypothetical protein
LVADEFEYLSETYAHDPAVHPMIQFQDVIFLGTSRAALKWAADFVTELERREVSTPFYIMSRAEAIIANADLLPRLVERGLSSVEIGIESGVDRILKLYNKRNSADRNHEAIALLQRHRICYDASGFIMFDPRITLAELRINAQYLHELGHATWDRYVTKLQIFPGAAIREELEANDIWDADAGLGDVYSYRYVDSPVGELSSYVWMYDDHVRALDNAIHNARAQLAHISQPASTVAALKGSVLSAQGVYRDHFLALIDLAEAGDLGSGFEARMVDFLMRVEVARAAIVGALALLQSVADFPRALDVPAPAPEGVLV